MLGISLPNMLQTFTWTWICFLLDMFKHLQKGNKGLAPVDNEKSLARLKCFFIELTTPLQHSVGAGNNKAALFRLLALLSDHFDGQHPVYWGGCQQSKVVCIAFSMRDKTDYMHRITDNLIACRIDKIEQSIDLSEDALAVMIEATMRTFVQSSSVVYWTLFMMDRWDNEINPIILANLQHPVSVVAHEEAAHTLEDWRRPAMHVELALHKYRVRSGALGYYDRIASDNRKTHIAADNHTQTIQLGDSDWVLI